MAKGRFDVELTYGAENDLELIHACLSGGTSVD